MIIKKMPCCFI